MNPFISICIPAYKNIAYSQRLLESVKNQTFKNFEVVITDDTPGLEIKKLADQYNSKIAIKYYKNPVGLGVPGNWNEGMKKATGNWIKMMHDDDWFSHPTALQEFADVAQKTPHKFIFSACNNIYFKKGKEKNEYLEGWRSDMLHDSIVNLLYLNVIGHPSTTMHRKDDSILYDSRFKWVVDIDFYIRYMEKYPGFEYIPNMLVNIGWDESKISHQLFKNPSVEIPEYFTLLARFSSDILINHRYVFHLIWDLVKRFKIRSLSDINQFGYNGQLPDKVQEIINCQENIPNIILKREGWSEHFMKKCFKKLSR